MLRKISTILFLLLFVANMSYSQQEVLKKKSPLLNENTITNVQSLGARGTDSPVTAANYVAVDTMGNAFGPGSAAINPLAYDPLSNVMAVVHRAATTYGLGTGELWWNYSTDMGATWARSLTSVQNGLTSQILARYPSMALHNPDQSTALADMWGCFSWPELQVSFAYLGYGVTVGMESSAFAEINFDPPLYGSNVVTFSDDEYVYWYTDNQDNASIRLFRTTDYSVIEIIDPPTWASATFNDGGGILLGGADHDGVVYTGLLATFPDTIGDGGWEPGYSKSTDNGSTWSDWFVVNWLNIPVTAEFDEIWDWLKGDAFISYSGDMVVDGNGLVHIVTGMTDTANGRNAIVEYYETSEGVWDAKIVRDSIKDNTWYDPPDAGVDPTSPALGQMGYAPYLATTSDGDFFVCQWVEGSPTAGDTLCDIYMKYRKSDGEWTSGETDDELGINLTETDGMNDNGAHLAPQMAVVEEPGMRHYYAFSMYWYEEGVTTAQINTLNRSVIYVAAVNVYSEPIVGVDDDFIVNSYNLEQNFPNPFNPSTSIKYTLAEKSNVVLKVYDVLGKEVATLVNTNQNAGSHEIRFDASNLSSGLYIYTIQAGNFNSSRKMMLLK